jgi:hypothetical protein
MPDIYHQILIGAPAEKVYDAITSQEGLSGWWTPAATAIPQINSIARFPYGSEYFKEMKIIDLIPSQLVTWSCITGVDEWVGTSISFELESGDKITLLKLHPEIGDQVSQQHTSNGTLIIFHHNDWKEYSAMFAECNYTWARFLWSLKLFCETGKGLPWPNQHSIKVL